MNTTTATADFSALVAVLEQPVCCTDDVHRRVGWVLELARALDSLPFAGIWSWSRKSGPVLPVDFDQATAVRVNRAYHADPATSWTDPVPTVASWMGTWAAANNLTTTGEDGAEVPA